MVTQDFSWNTVTMHCYWLYTLLNDLTGLEGRTERWKIKPYHCWKTYQQVLFLLEASFEDTKLSVVDIIVINFTYTAMSCHRLNFPSTNQTLRASGAPMRVCETYGLFSQRVWCGLTNLWISVWTCLSVSVNDKLRSLMNPKLWLSKTFSCLCCSVLLFQSQAGRIVAIGVTTYSCILSFIIH